MDGEDWCGLAVRTDARRERQLSWIFTRYSRALHAIFTPALLNWRVDKVR
jgi:hypothetical protein